MRYADQCYILACLRSNGHQVIMQIMRYVFAFTFFLLLSPASIASDEQVIHDCDYWRLGKDEAEEAKLRAACDQIINDKHFAKAHRAMAYAERASYASNKNRSDDAIADFDRALELEPDTIDWRSDRAYLLYFNKDYDRAIEDFDKVFASKPDAHLAAFRGKAYLAKGDETRGFADLDRSIEIAPDKSIYRYWRAQEYGKRGQTEAALVDAEKAVALQSDDRDSYILRSELYTKNGQLEKAIADLTRVAELSPDALLPYANRVLLYEQTKQYDLAIADYDKLLKLSPGSPYYTDRRAAVLEKMGRVPPSDVPSAVAPSAPPPAPPPVKAAEPTPEAPVVEKSAPKQASTGKGECRRFDAIANMTISVACPD